MIAGPFPGLAKLSARQVPACRLLHWYCGGTWYKLRATSSCLMLRRWTGKGMWLVCRNCPSPVKGASAVGQQADSWSHSFLEILRLHSVKRPAPDADQLLLNTMRVTRVQKTRLERQQGRLIFMPSRVLGSVER